MPTPLQVTLLFGGRSAEHEVSILSARSVAAAFPEERVAVTPMCIARDGRFIAPERSAKILAGQDTSQAGDAGFSFEVWSRTAGIDVVLPLTHGTGGEDGSLQGYLEILGLPYVGSGVTASAVSMDKIHMKYAFAAAKLPMVDFVPVLEHEWRNDRERIMRAVTNALRLPYFVKPANSGSSVGVHKVKNDADLTAAMDHALRFDARVLVERGVDAREIEVSVLGNQTPEASVPGEIAVGRDFYDYTDKYVENRSPLVIPARLAADKVAEVRRLALAAFKAVGASGFARVDFFLERGTNRLYVNEINTIPGFTNISMYPKLWEATEMKYPRLLEKLLALGVEHSQARAERGASTMQWLQEMTPLS